MDKIKAFLKDLQDRGIPLVYLQDPKTKLPSITYNDGNKFYIVCWSSYS